MGPDLIDFVIVVTLGRNSKMLQRRFSLFGPMSG